MEAARLSSHRRRCGHEEAIEARRDTLAQLVAEIVQCGLRSTNY